MGVQLGWYSNKALIPMIVQDVDNPKAIAEIRLLRSRAHIHEVGVTLLHHSVMLHRALSLYAVYMKSS